MWQLIRGSSHSRKQSLGCIPFVFELSRTEVKAEAWFLATLDLCCASETGGKESMQLWALLLDVFGTTAWLDAVASASAGASLSFAAAWMYACCCLESCFHGVVLTCCCSASFCCLVSTISLDEPSLLLQRTSPSPSILDRVMQYNSAGGGRPATLDCLLPSSHEL